MRDPGPGEYLDTCRKWIISPGAGTGGRSPRTTTREYKKGSYVAINGRLKPRYDDGDHELVERHGWTYASDEEREIVVKRLRDAGSEGRLTTNEMESLVEMALRARTRERLEVLLKGLPIDEDGMEVDVLTTGDNVRALIALILLIAAVVFIATAVGILR